MDGSSFNRHDNDEKQSIFEVIAFFSSSTRKGWNEIMQNVFLLKENVANRLTNSYLLSEDSMQKVHDKDCNRTSISFRIL